MMNPTALNWVYNNLIFYIMCSPFSVNPVYHFRLCLLLLQIILPCRSALLLHKKFTGCSILKYWSPNLTNRISKKKQTYKQCKILGNTDFNRSLLHYVVVWNILHTSLSIELFHMRLYFAAGFCVIHLLPGKEYRVTK